MKYQVLVSRLGFFIFFIGVIIGFALSAIIIWGDMEASLFTSGIQAEEKWDSLKCPMIITYNEQAKITAEFENPLDQTVERYARANITQGFVTYTRQVESHVPVEPGTTEPIEWEIFPEDAAYEKLILFRVYVFQKRSLPSMDGQCGVVLLDVPSLTGTQIGWILFLTSFTLIITGRLIWESKNRIKDKFIKNISRALNGLALTLLLCILVSYYGFWAVGIVLLAMIIILTGAMMGAYVTAQ